MHRDSNGNLPVGYDHCSIGTRPEETASVGSLQQSMERLRSHVCYILGDANPRKACV